MALKKLAVLAVGLSLCSAPAPALCGTPAAKARDLARRAAVLAAKQQYEHAISLYEKAYALVPDPALLYNVGRLYDRAGELERARAYYEKYVSEERDPDRLAKGRQRLEDLLDRIPGSVELAVDPPAAAVEVDGRPITGGRPLVVPGLRRGSHEVTATLAGYAPGHLTIEVPPGGEVRAELALRPLPMPPRAEVAAPPLAGRRPPAAAPRAVPVATAAKPRPAARYSPWQWVAVGSGSAMLVAGGVLTGLAAMERGKVTGAGTWQAGPSTVTGATRASALSWQTSANRLSDAGIAMFAAGGAAVATGVVLAVLDARRPHPAGSVAPAITLSAGFEPGGAMVQATGRFR